MSSANPALPLRFLRLRGGLRALSLRLYPPSASPLPLPLSFSTSDPSAQAFIIHQVHIGESIRTLELTPESTLAGPFAVLLRRGPRRRQVATPSADAPGSASLHLSRRYLATLPGAVTWHRYLAPLPGTVTWHRYLASFPLVSGFHIFVVLLGDFTVLNGPK